MPPTRRAFDTATMTRFLSYVLDPTIGCCEVRIFGAERKKGNIVRSEYHTTVAGWFDDIEALIAEVTTCQKVSVYLTLNPVTSDLMYRDGSNHLARTRTGSSDDDIVVIRWLYIDIDPVRSAGISSTDTELALALAKLNRVLDEVPGLRECAIWGCSGNGGWILVALPDLPNLPETRDLVARGLQALAAQFSDKAVKVDPSVKNPSRVMCLPGTLKCKGTHGAERPWRPVTLDTPDDGGPLCRFDLAGYLATQAPVVVAPTPAENVINAAHNGTDGGLLAVRIATYLAKFHPAVQGEQGSDQCFDAACALVQGYGLEPDQAFPYLAQWNMGNVPPFSDAELAHKLTDATRVANGGKRRGYLLERNQQDTDGAAQVPAGEEHAGVAAGTEDNPDRLARVIYYRDFQHVDGPTLWYWKGTFYVWTGSYYREMDTPELRVRLTRAISAEMNAIHQQQLREYGIRKPQANGEARKAPVPIKVTMRLVSDVLQALGGISYLDSDVVKSQPFSLNGSVPWPVEEILPARNGLLHIPSYLAGDPYFLAPTPTYFSTSSLDYDFDPDAEVPVNWLTFLGALQVTPESAVRFQVWANDRESIDTLQEWFYLHLEANTRYQKILALIGPKRSGKGTVASILTAMIGESFVAGPTLSDLGEKFGLEPLIGSRAAIIDDARIGSKTDQAVVAERLLSISGVGRLTINRKHVGSWTGKLGTKVTLMSNELPKIADSAGALAGRFLILRMTESFYDREDIELESKLRPELPGILLWAIEGWKRLKARGRLLQPGSGRELLEDMEDLSSPIKAFVDDVCDVGEEFSVECSILYAVWVGWCKEHGKREPGEVNTFSRNLRSVVARLKTIRPCEEGVRVRKFGGIQLRPPGYYAEDGTFKAF